MHISDNCDGVELNFSLPNEASKVNYHGNKGIKTAIYVMFKTRAAVFYWGLTSSLRTQTHFRLSRLNHEAQPSGFIHDTTRAASFFNGFKNIPGKACVKRVHDNDFCERWKLAYEKNIKHLILIRRKVLSGFKTTARDVL